MADNCSELSAQISALASQVARLKILTESQVKQIATVAANTVVDERLPPKIIEIENKLLGVETTATAAKSTADNALSETRATLGRILKVETTANNAQSEAIRASASAMKADRDAAEAARKAVRAQGTADTAEATGQGATRSAGEAKTIGNNALDEAIKAKNSAFTADRKATSSLDVAREASLESKLAKGIANQADFKAGSAINRATSAEGMATGAATKAAGALAEATNAKNAVGGLRGLINGIGAKIEGFGQAISALESKVGGAIQKAAEAIGISKNALAATGKLAGQVLEIFNVIGTIFTILDGIATRELLGARIDAIEAGLQALSNSISGIFGTLLRLQNRIANNEATIGQVKAIAVDARLIGEAANLRAGSAYVLGGQAQATANSATTKAVQAQTTADGAERNAVRANENATTAYQKANEAEGIGQKALKLGGDALGKAGQALTAALTALAIAQAVRSLKGLKGDPGVPGLRGLQGAPGMPGIPGTNGRDGVTAIVTLPGTPGSPGRNGVDGRNGATGRQGVQGIPGQRGANGSPGLQGAPGINGRDANNVNPAETASLRALIIAQHAQTRANVNSTSTGLVNGVKAFFTTQLASITTLITLIATNTYVEKALAVLTFAATVHNALMLSSNLGQTLFMIIDQVTGFILPKGINGQPISIADTLGKAVHEVLEQTVGEATTGTIQQTWDKANRIYQAAAGVFNHVTNLGGILTAGMEVIGGNVGKIGNALRKGGVLLENAYTWMNPQPNLKGKFFDFLHVTGEQATVIATLVALPIAISGALGDVNTSVGDLKREIAQVDPKDANGNPIKDAEGKIIHYKPGLAVPDPEVVKATGDQAKADSTNFLELVLEDIFDGGD
ncbi:MAG: collagen-like protein [Nostoc sp.]|uniref:collagen-like triple helix repeat-containing protein n=1 Tax=Nostoc sp. TaxID=1180 RepID=UPI002FF7FBA7